jgi:hypothetical protein
MYPFTLQSESYASSRITGKIVPIMENKFKLEIYTRREFNNATDA